MESRWSDHEAESAVSRYAAGGVSRDVALRVYTTRLLGADPRLVLHGGGNTSVKTTATTVLGEEVEVLCVKGSGWNMATIEPPGMPAVRLEPLRRLIELEALSDEDMVNAQRINLLDATAPTPSVEALLHAFLPHKFVDHTHANAVLSLTDQPDGEALCREVYGDRVVVLPYVPPGFELSKRAYEAYKEHEDCVGIVLAKHGVFSFGETAKESYDRMIELVTMAETRCGRKRPFAAGERSALPAAAVAPVLRGLTALRSEGKPPRPFVVSFRSGDRVLEYVNGSQLDRYSQEGVVTPDHVIRTKPRPLLTAAPRDANLETFARETRRAVDAYVADYSAYFEKHNAGQAVPRIPLDPMPRVILVPGLGLFGLGESPRAAAIAADLAETAADVILDAEAIGTFQSISSSETFDMEYWPLEQAKLSRVTEAPLARRIVVITGGAGTIGAATARAFADAGAAVVLLDRDGEAAAARASELGGLGLVCDVTDPQEVRHAFDAVCEAYGGVDIVVSNAGAAWQGRIGEVADAELRESFELNFFAHQNVARTAVGVMLAQAIGGVLLFNVSKQAVNPGAGFGPYGLPKVATMALVRQYAVDYGCEGIRSNGVNADRIRSGMVTEDLVRSRAEARGLSLQEYMAGNLLGREVTADDVAQAFVALALAEKTTGAMITVDGGNIAAALR